MRGLRGQARRIPLSPNVSSVLSPSQAKAARRGGAGCRAGNMRQCALFLTSLVPIVLAPRPPDEPGFGSPQRLGKDPGSWLGPAPGAWGAQLSGKSREAGSVRCLGAGCGRLCASRGFQRGKGVWLSDFGERREMGSSP